MPLQQLTYTIDLLAPVLLTNSVGDENILMSDDYLAGTALLGMFARRYLDKAKLSGPAHQEETFRKWFLAGGLRFLNGYKASSQGLRSLPIPLSVEFPKYGDDDQQPAIELIFEDAADVAANTKHRDAYCVMNPAGIEKVAVAKATHFHHRRTNPVIGHSQSGEIFNYEFIKPQQRFLAAVVGEPDEIAKFLMTLGPGELIGHLGRSRQTEYGRVKIHFTEPGERAADGEIPGMSPAVPARGDASFTLTLLSHAILPNAAGHPQVQADLLAWHLSRALQAAGVQPGSVQLAKSFVRGVEIENYVAVWQARKPAVTALRMGSCFLFTLTRELPEPEWRQLDSVLRQWQEQGIGWRCNEGFGRLAINWQRPPAAGVTAAHGREYSLPNLTASRRQEQREQQRQNLQRQLDKQMPPALVQNIFRGVMQAYLEEKCLAQATSDVELFAGELPGAQISRLQRFAETAPSEAHFKIMLGELPRLSRDRLAGIHSKQEHCSLLEFLQRDHLDSREGRLYRRWAGLLDREAKALSRALNADLLADGDLRLRLLRKYFSTFFALLRKRNRPDIPQRGPSASQKRNTT
ncbi:MAG: hypothetical protein DKINENOH_04827 [bacterium]|nr:hypothetical protein [bacterium]